MEIVPGLHRLRTPMTSNALPWIMPYAFEGPDGVSLFDSGYGTPEATEWLTRQLQRIGYQPSDIRRLIVSHGHADHVGMAAWIKEQSPDCELVMLEREAEWFHDMRREPAEFMSRASAWLVRHGVEAGEVSGAFQRASTERTQSADGKPSGDVATETARGSWTTPPVAADVRLSDGEVLEFDGWRLEAVWTPGHTPGHLCVYETQHRLMFTGDHVLSRITPNVSLNEQDEQEERQPLGEFLASLDRVAAYDTKLALPAHEEVIEDLPARCAAIARHHADRLEEVYEGIDDESTAAEVSAEVTWNRPYETFNMFKRRSALGETLAHLELLEARGRVRSGEDDGVVRWEQL